MEAPEPVRVMVVDDEPLTRASLASKLRRMEAVEVVAEAGDVEEARSLIGSREPDALFVDILMPGGSGLDLARQLSGGPAIVFVTAHEDFAVEAFELDAVDYLTKPVRPARLREAVGRVRRELTRRTSRSEHAAEGPAEEERHRDVLLDQRGHVSHFVVRKHQRIMLVPVKDLRWAEASGNYLRLHTASGTHLIRSPLYELEAALDPSRFRRIHRSTIVSLAEIGEITSDGHGSYDVHLRSGSVLRMTRTYRSNLVP